MNIGTITQNSMELTADFGEIPAQWSANFTVTVEIDSAFAAYTPYLSIGYHSGRKVNAALIAIVNGEATIPAVVYQQSGQIPISVTLINGDEVINTRPLFVTVVGAPMVQADVDPADPSFIAQVQAIIDSIAAGVQANAEAAASSATSSAESASSAQESLDTLLDQVGRLYRSKTITIPTSGWTQSGSSYYKDFSDTSMKATVVPIVEYADSATAAKLGAYALMEFEEFDGYLRATTTTVPTTSFVIRVVGY